MIEIKQLTLQFGERTLFADVNLQFTPSHRYGLVGANGSGKSTFLKVLSGEEKGFTGTVTLPNRLQLGVLKQDHFDYENEKILHVVLMGRSVLWEALMQKNKLFRLQCSQCGESY